MAVAEGLARPLPRTAGLLTQPSWLAALHTHTTRHPLLAPVPRLTRPLAALSLPPFLPPPLLLLPPSPPVLSSLGGAMATLCALDLRLNLKMPDVRVYTFGSPRVGNLIFAQWFEGVVQVRCRHGLGSLSWMLLWVA